VKFDNSIFLSLCYVDVIVVFPPFFSLRNKVIINTVPPQGMVGPFLVIL